MTRRPIPILRRPPAAAFALALVLAACGGGGAGSSPTPQGGRLGEGIRRQIAQCQPSGLSLSVTATDNQFDKDCLAAPEGQAFSIAFKNEGSERHNVAISTEHGSGDVLFRGDVIPGGTATTYNVTPLRPGTYHFHCDVHPAEMQGTFVVE